MIKHFDSILFDFDGVLLDSEPLHYACWVEVLRPFGFELSWETYAKSCIGVADRLMIQQFAANLNLEFEKLWAQYPRKKELFRSRMESELTFPGETLDLVRELAPRYKLAVVSSSARVEVEPLLERAGIREHFSALVCGSEMVARLKPAPDPYLKAAELLGASKPLVVEDSDAGEQSGRAAGFEVLRLDDARELAARLRTALSDNIQQ
jgi:beta-phosphoglucomutase